MDTILEEKKKGEVHFRTQIDQFLANSIFTKEEDQLSPNVLQEILFAPNFEGMVSNGKINVERLCEGIASSEGTFNEKQLMKILGHKRQIKISQLHQILRNYDLHEFDLEEEIVKHLFENENFSLKKLDKVMKSLGYPVLNAKDRQILIECFDMDKNKLINRADLEEMMDKCVNLREKEKTERTEKMERKAVMQLKDEQ